MSNFTSIEQVIQKLDAIIARCQKNKSPNGYFACTYRSMTLAVLKGVQQNKFENGHRMVNLDIAFAGRYFEALEQYENGQKCSNSWYAAFEAAKNPRLLILQHILLGINAHINLDLGVAAASIMPYRKINPLKNDFAMINEIISKINQKVQESISEICYPVGVIDQLSNGNDNLLLDFAISKARQTSWATASVLSHASSFIRPPLIRMVDNAAAQIATNIIVSPRTPKQILAKLKECESSDVAGNIDVLSATEV
ncbi:hypothetical protein H1R16_08925 [Marnyiella aurantia]|uniref:Uncharacterized protein n=1 Tax=Marnyiella aurantia TaxID=2758037 RepID=A0A7D7LP47_9FLAO|nr:DUF5995 family protein [Marnyiella aurantia]MBA5246816.1 hypothetical protein [Marnyiella aurantia]QMS97836.1 hypothetical protein H1R16_08925 [Marnyiella aurantia]